jgi:hypothetical protein
MPEARTTIIYNITLCFTRKKYIVHNSQTLDIATHQSGARIKNELQIHQAVEAKYMNDLTAKCRIRY